MRKENRISSKKRKGYRDEKAALIILLIWIFLAVCVPLFGPYSPTEQNAEIRNQPMSLIHFFGTDEFGRDNFTRVWYGAGISLVIGVGSSLINGMIGILYGAVAGYRGKRIDMILMRAADVIAAIPSILYVILITLVMGHGDKKHDLRDLYCRLDRYGACRTGGDDPFKRNRFCGGGKDRWYIGHSDFV